MSLSKKGSVNLTGGSLDPLKSERCLCPKKSGKLDLQQTPRFKTQAVVVKRNRRGIAGSLSEGCSITLRCTGRRRDTTPLKIVQSGCYISTGDGVLRAEIGQFQWISTGTNLGAVNVERCKFDGRLTKQLPPNNVVIMVGARVQPMCRFIAVDPGTPVPRTGEGGKEMRNVVGPCHSWHR